MKEIGIRDIEGIKFGHAGTYEDTTGCTVILCEKGAVAGVDVRGGAPATRETDLLRPENMVERIHAVVLSGGSAFGLEAACGVMEYLERRGVGFDTGVAKVPLVVGASLFDLAVGKSCVRPNKEMGVLACGQAMSPSKDDQLEGNVGAGIGCSVGKLAGMEHAMKSGIGIAGLEIDGLQVAVVVALNAAGNVIDKNGDILAGVHTADGKPVKTEQLVLKARKEFAQLASGSAVGKGAASRDASSRGAASVGAESMGDADKGAADKAAAGKGAAGDGAAGKENSAQNNAGKVPSNPVENTTIGCIVTNAKLTKAQATKIASMAQDGLARAINPVHTSNDGDTLFVMGTCEVSTPNPVDTIGILSAELVEQAIRNAVKKAKASFGLPAIN